MSLGYIVKEGLAGIGRARLAAITSMFSLFVAVLLVGVLARLGYNAYELAQTLRSSIEVEVFLEDLDQRSTQEIHRELESYSFIHQMDYISKDSAAAIFRSEFGAEGETMAELKFLPASFRTEMSPEASAADINQFVEEVAQIRGVEEVRYNQRLVELMETRMQNFVLIGGGIGIFILLTAIILVFNTIRLTIYAKRGLIKAMKLVGATNAFIRRPFLVEGLFQGIIAGSLAIGAQFVLFEYLIPRYIPQFGILAWPYGRWYYLTGAMIVLAIIMGYWGSRWAARKFIKETAISQT
ncbi:MAG: cell division protein FtsX [Bacteroidota bacterium]